MTFEGEGPFSGDFNELKNVPTIPSPADGVNIVDDGNKITVNRPFPGESIVRKLHLGGFTLDTETAGNLDTSKDRVGVGSDAGKSNVVNAKRENIGVSGDRIEIDVDGGVAPAASNGENGGRIRLDVNGNTQVLETNNQDGANFGRSFNTTVVLNSNNGVTLNSLFLEAEGGANDVGALSEPASSGIDIEEVRIFESKPKEVIGVP